MRKYARIDNNHAEIVKQLNDCGLYVRSAAQLGNGFPDLVVAGRRVETGEWVNLLVEVKSKGGKMTPDEKLFHSAWPGPVIVAQAVEDVLRWFGRI